MMASPKQNRILELNDQMRTRGPVTTPSSMWVMTPGIQALGAAGILEVVQGVQSFSAFSSDNDPHGEHDFGSFDIAGKRVLWKIDYYDRSLTGGSPDAADETLTQRVLTIMLVSEY